MENSPAVPATATKEFYRAKLNEAFRYSRPFSERSGSVAEQVVDTPEADAILRECPPGSLDAARRLGELAVVRLNPIPTAPGPWWRDLLHYERSWFLQSATTVEGPPTNRPRRGISALSANFTWAMPELLQRLQSGAGISEDLRRPKTLLFCRQSDGQVRVIEIGGAVEKVFRATNGLRTVDQIAAAADVPVTDAERVLQALAPLGGVVLAMSPDEMTRAIEARQRP